MILTCFVSAGANAAARRVAIATRFATAVCLVVVAIRRRCRAGRCRRQGVAGTERRRVCRDDPRHQWGQPRTALLLGTPGAVARFSTYSL